MKHQFARSAAIGVAAVLVYTLAPGARAEVHIEGSPAAVRVTTSHDAISAVLSALGETFKVKYHTEIALDTIAGATYSGSIREVISSLLDGYNYVVMSDQDRIKIVVYGKRGGAAIPAPPAPPATPAKGIVSQWRQR
jgi:3-hydroxy-3-methylglutaryl CoA synthase